MPHLILGFFGEGLEGVGELLRNNRIPFTIPQTEGERYSISYAKSGRPDFYKDEIQFKSSGSNRRYLTNGGLLKRDRRGLLSFPHQTI